MIRVLFFGPLADSVGERVVELDFEPGLRLQTVRDRLAEKYPEAFAMLAFIAVNGAQTRDLDRCLGDGAEIAFMAKFSGG